MKTIRALQRLAAEIIATAPRKAAASIILILAVSMTEAANLVMLVPLLGMVGVDQPTSMATEWLAKAFAAFGMTPTLGGALLLRRSRLRAATRAPFRFPHRSACPRGR